MAEKYIGCTVSICCKDGLGVYQGKVIDVSTENQTLVLKKAFKNGIPCGDTHSVILSAHIIENLRIIDAGQETPKPTSIVSVTKPVAKRANKPVPVSETLVHNKLLAKPAPEVPSASVKPLPAVVNSSLKESPRKFNIDSSSFQAALYGDLRQIPGNYKNTRRQRWPDKDEACFGAPINYYKLTKEFDFEKNLALFNKQAVFDEINASQRPDLVRQTDRANRCRPAPDEPTNIRSRQIFVSQPGPKEYITDEGLIIPSITSTLRDQLFTLAEENHLTIARQCEIMGRAVTEITIPLLGGVHRLSPLNSHQRPLVVAMCGPHRAGAMGANAARILSTHGVDTILFLSHPLHFYEHMARELVLYRQTGNKLTSNIHELPTTGVDLIIMALVDDQLSQMQRSFSNWANENKAALLAVDPPASGTPAIRVKYSVLPILPLSHSPDNGKLYLANLGIPHKLFSELNIRYKSPFGHRFVIPLHSCD